MFLLACAKVLLKDPRLTPDFISLNFALSSYTIFLSLIFSAKMSIRNVSACTLVKLLFLSSILKIGSLFRLISHFWTSSFMVGSFRCNYPLNWIQLCIQQLFKTLYFLLWFRDVLWCGQLWWKCNRDVISLKSHNPKDFYPKLLRALINYSLL